MNDHNDNDVELQVRAKAVLRESRNTGGELLCFTLPIFGGLELVCIVNIPAEGDTTAPVYCKIKRARSAAPKTNGRRMSRADRDHPNEITEEDSAAG